MTRALYAARIIDDEDERDAHLEPLWAFGERINVGLESELAESK
jgi:hypothetical protein